MKFEGEVVVVGANAFNDSVEGKLHDNTKVFIQTPIDEGRGYGSTSQAYTWGDHTNMEKIKHLLPNVSSQFKAKAVFEVVTSGNRSTTKLVELNPINAPAPSKSA